MKTYNYLSSKPKEECGVIGVYAPGEDVARLVYFGLHALQHRGQESAGIATSDGNTILVYKDMGLVPQVFNEKALASLRGGSIAIGHARYSTTGSTNWDNAQPIYRSHKSGAIAVAHNGNLINTTSLRDYLSKNGSEFTSTSDSEVIAELIIKEDKGALDDAIEKTMEKLKGAYSVVVLAEDALYAFRDPYGIRPLSIGKLKKGFVVSSETCGLDILGAPYLREVEPGELVKIDKNGLTGKKVVGSAKPSLCIFEFIYFARPDSSLYNRNLYHARKHMGMSLAKESPVNADLVIPVPDSGNCAAIGFAEASGIPFGEGLIKNRYIGRTFIQPSQSIRQLGIRLKLNPLKEIIEGKRLVVVDDSIVRGNTSKKIVSILKEAGAKEVHLRISSPPVKYPCFYGIDTATKAELIASDKTVEEIRKYIGADSLKYLSFERLVASTKRPYGEFCLACFDGVYPIPIPKETKLAKLMLEEESPVGG